LHNNDFFAAFIVGTIPVSIKNTNMKPISLILLCVTLTLTSAVTLAQKTAPTQKLFAAYPESVNLDRSLMNNTFLNKQNADVAVSFSGDFVFKGTVISNENRYDNLQIIIIRSSEDKNSLLQISKITNQDKSISYAGRILNNTAADGYVIKRIGEDYVLQKIDTQKIFEPCNL
jgi:hypothetical protein